MCGDVHREGSFSSRLSRQRQRACQPSRLAPQCFVAQRERLDFAKQFSVGGRTKVPGRKEPGPAGWMRPICALFCACSWCAAHQVSRCLASLAHWALSEVAPVSACGRQTAASQHRTNIQRMTQAPHHTVESGQVCIAFCQHVFSLSQYCFPFPCRCCMPLDD